MRSLAILGAILALGGCNDPFDMSKCDAAIKETLKSPASYHRASVEGGNGSYWIEFDAVNSFNAPIRYAGRCTIIAGEASWSAAQPR